MTGDVKMSAEKRLTIWNLPDNEETTENNNENVSEVKSKMMKLIKLAKDGGLEKLRMKSENIDLLQTFVSYCLIHFTTSLYWRYNACNVVISEIFTASDEALCILLIENNAEDYAKMFQEQKKLVGRTRDQSILKLSVAIKNSKVGIEEVFIGSTVL